jgi:aerobic-type carbon monoxide dehydrogenase small subunit (CoxS/CutS family)
MASLHLTVYRADACAGISPVEAEADAAAPLLDILRRSLGVRSAMRGCQDGSCGSCRVILNGALVSSCLVKWGEVADGSSVEAYEDLERDAAAARAVAAFSAERPTRCRLCVGALGVTAVAIARASEASPSANREEIVDDALRGATCMCTGRGSWRRALSV